MNIFESVARDDAVCWCGVLAAENDNLSEGNRKPLNTFFRDMEKWLVSVLSSHREELSSTVPPLQVARVVIAGLEGALLIDRLAGNNQCIAAQKNLVPGMLR